MSFNIRDEHREGRRQSLVVAPRDADLFDPRARRRSRGLQETLGVSDRQSWPPCQAMPWSASAVTCPQGRRLSAILFKGGRFRVADAGTFWFSDTPEVPASNLGQQHHSDLHLDEPHRSRWPRLLSLQPAPRPRVQPSRERSTALLPPAYRGACVSGRSGRRDRRFQCRRA